MRVLGSIALCLGIVGGGYAILAFSAAAPETEGAEDQPEPQEAAVPATNVAVRVLRPQHFEKSLQITGHLEAWETVSLSAEVPGRIEWQGVEEGDTVEADQELIRIDTEALQIELDRASARAKQTALELKRVRDLERGGVSSPRDLDNAVTDEELADAELRAAKLRLEKSTIKTPLAATIDVLDHEEGEYVEAGAQLARLVQVHRLKVIVGLPEREIPNFDTGREVALTFDALPGETFTGSIYRIATSADMQTRSFRTEIALDNDARRLRPGMNARVRLVTSVHEDVVVAPLFSIVALENQFFTAVEADGIAELRNVQVGAVEGGRALITSGLDAGERLIVEGHRDLRDGARVTVTSVENE